MQKHGSRRGRAVWATAVAALAAGLMGGLVARLLMRAVALAIGGDTAFTLAMTVAIVVLFAVLALPAAATATARPAVRHGGRWVTVTVTGWASARTGIGDAKAILLADEGQLPLISALAVAFAVTVTAHGRFAQWMMRRLMGTGEQALTGAEHARNTGSGEQGTSHAAASDLRTASPTDEEAPIRGSCQSSMPITNEQQQ
ncbi:hypothetical protein [Streptosporangium sp. NPDC051022]|uniref:hypothetical protein n=1 Tax=Streptosporangium sp. NPDC051022 TaxID=3155752 RepID=UPI003449AF03